MKKSTLVEVITLAISGVLAGGLGKQLADHNVGIAAIAATVCFTLTTGLYFTAFIGQALRTTHYTCPAKGCTVSIRTTNVSQAELDHFRKLATDHSKHGGAR